VLSDLRESGSIENDADIVIFCWRPEYYGIESCEHKGITYHAKGLAVIDIAKGRNIGTNEILLSFSGQYSRFTDYNENSLNDLTELLEEKTTIDNPFN
jgi:replicative DNA helicase